MRSLVRHVSAAPGADVGLDYDRAGERYRAYADGDVDKLYEFDGSTPMAIVKSGEFWETH